MSRACDGCTACCDGTLLVEAFGQRVYPGKPCPVVDLGVGCTRWTDPDKPAICDEFRCEWLDLESIPLWMKPDRSHAIIRLGIVQGQPYAELIEVSGKTVAATTLSWFIPWAINMTGNARWRIQGGWHYIGTAEFLAACDEDLALGAGPVSL